MLSSIVRFVEKRGEILFFLFLHELGSNLLSYVITLTQMFSVYLDVPLAFKAAKIFENIR